MDLDKEIMKEVYIKEGNTIVKGIIVHYRTSTNVDGTTNTIITYFTTDSENIESSPSNVAYAGLKDAILPSMASIYKVTSSNNILPDTIATRLLYGNK